LQPSSEETVQWTPGLQPSSEETVQWTPGLQPSSKETVQWNVGYWVITEKRHVHIIDCV